MHAQTPASFQVHSHLQSHSKTTPTFSLTPRPPASFPDHSHLPLLQYSENQRVVTLMHTVRAATEIVAHIWWMEVWLFAFLCIPHSSSSVDGLWLFSTVTGSLVVKLCDYPVTGSCFWTVTLVTVLGTAHIVVTTHELERDVCCISPRVVSRVGSSVTKTTTKISNWNAQFALLLCYRQWGSEVRGQASTALMICSHCGWFPITSHVGSNPVVYVWELSQMCPAATVFLPFSTVYIYTPCTMQCNIGEKSHDTQMHGHMIPVNGHVILWPFGWHLAYQGLRVSLWILVDIFGNQDVVHVVSAEESCCFDSHCVWALSYSWVVSLNGHLGS